MKIWIAFSTFVLITNGTEAKTSKKCQDTDGKVYMLGQGYVTNCTQFTCQAIGPKQEMVASLSSYCCWLDGEEYSIGEIVSTKHVTQVKHCESVEGKTTLIDETSYGLFCVYEEEIVPVGARLPQLEMCSWISCTYVSINQTKMPSLKLDVVFTPPGTGCCLGEDDKMYREGENRIMESGLESICKRENWEMPPTSNFNLVVSGGWDSNWKYLGSPELITSDGRCSNGIPLLPVNIIGARSIYLDNHLLVCGGGTGSSGMKGYLNSCFKLNSSSSDWIPAAPLNIERSGFSLTKVGNELFVLGGDNKDGYGPYALDSIEKFSSGRWQLLSQTMTSGRSNHHTVYMETKNSLVVIGGYYINKVEMLDLKSLTWSLLDPLPVHNLLYPSSVIYQDTVTGEETILVTGGSIDRIHQSKVWKMSMGSWSLAGELLEGREFHSIGILDGMPVIVGGNGGGRERRLASLERMDSEGIWKKLPRSLSVGRYYHAMAAVPADDFPCPLV